MKEKQEQKVTSMPRIGDKAPEFTAVTTQGEINFPSLFGKLGYSIQSSSRSYSCLYFGVHDFCSYGRTVCPS